MKRTSDKQITKDDFEGEGEEEEEKEARFGPDAYARATTEVLATRRIVKAKRRHVPVSQPNEEKENEKEAPAFNPFAGGGFKLVPVSEKETVEEKTDKQVEGTKEDGGKLVVAKEEENQVAMKKEQDEEEKEGSVEEEEEEEEEGKEEASEPKSGEKEKDDAGGGEEKATYNGFANRPNPFASASGASLFGKSNGSLSSGTSAEVKFGLTTGGFGSLAATGTGFGGLAAAGTTAGFVFGSAASSGQGKTTSIFGNKDDAEGANGHGDKDSTADLYSSKHTVVQLEEKEVKTGEEDERVVCSLNGVLYEFVENSWKERGRGDVRINIDSNKHARIVMRSKGNLRLLMNAKLWPEMQCNKMVGTNGVTFAVVNHASPALEEEDQKVEEKAEENGKADHSLSTFAIRVKSPELVEQLMAAIDKHKMPVEQS